MTGYLERVRGVRDIRTFHVDVCEVTGRTIRRPVRIATLERALELGLPVVEVRA